MNEMDEIDKRMLRALQDHGRATYDELGLALGLSPSTVLRRVRRLEESGVIVSYRAMVDAKKAGMGLQAYINVRLEKHIESTQRSSPMEQFRVSVETWPEVIECVSLTGEMDFLLRVVAVDMAHFSNFISEKLLRHPSVRDCKSSFVLDTVKRAAGLPL